MMLVYVAPNGRKYQYEEGTQPEGYVLADAQPKGYAPKNKARKAAAKRRTPANKKAKADDK